LARKKTSDRAVDAAEQWLRDNDPEYAQRSQAWHTPRTDALERALVSLDSVSVDDAAQAAADVLIGAGRGIPAVIGNGHYRKTPTKTSDEL
jgi:hypothetical protein